MTDKDIELIIEQTHNMPNRGESTWIGLLKYKFPIPEEELVYSGHTACPGCGASLAMKYVLKGLGPDPYSDTAFLRRDHWRRFSFLFTQDPGPQDSF